MKKILILFFSILFINGFSQDTLKGYTLHKDTIKLQQIEVSAPYPHQATFITPITFDNLSKQEIETKNYGQEPSTILNTTPAITSYSDAGSPWGYSYIRLRGIDQTRINFTLNGVPMNEPEDQGCYFSNYPDFFQTLDMIQIQRGNGLTKNGVSSFGGSLNFDSHLPIKTSVSATFGYGSFNSMKIGFQIDQKWKKGGFYIQFSDISTDGYKYHSGNHSQSFFLNSFYDIGKSKLKFIAFAGRQQNQLAWLGVPYDSVWRDRRTNGATDKEHDQFEQYHLQFHHAIDFNSNTRLNYAVYYNFLTGYYTFDYKNFLGIPSSDSSVNYGIDKYNFKSNWVGAYVNLTKRISRFNFYVGTHAYTYNRQHSDNNDLYGYMYTNTGYRNELSAYFKARYNVWEGLNLFGDIQYRYTDFKYNGDISYDEYYMPHYNVNLPTFTWNFINYDLGIDYKYNNTVFYYSFGVTNREPSRNDIFNGYDYLPCDSIGNPVYNNLHPERSIDNELGFRVLTDNLSWDFNFFYMNFSNEIVLNGKIGASGVPLHDNVDKSYRRGIETDFRYKCDNGFGVNINGSYNDCGVVQSNNMITTPILSPKWIGNVEGYYKYKWFTVGLAYRYQDYSVIGYIPYMGYDLAEVIDAYYTLNGRIGINWKWVDFNIFVNNITDVKYFNSGQLNWDGTKPLYFVGAPINFFASLKMTLNYGKNNK